MIKNTIIWSISYRVYVTVDKFIVCFSLLWTAEFEVTNIIKDIAINAKNMGDTRIVEPNQPIQKVFIDQLFGLRACERFFKIFRS